MRFQYKTIAFVAAAFCCSHLGCKKDPVTSSAPKSLREFSWTVDTLDYPGSFQTVMFDIWGTASNNLYVVGHNDRGFGKMYGFDGTTWSDIKLSVSQGGTLSRTPDLTGIYGFAPNKMWAVGDLTHNNPNPPPNYFLSSAIIHFDGRSWREIDLSGFSTQPQQASLETIWGSSPSDIWAAGMSGTIFHYDGIAWQKIPPPRTFPPEIFFSLNSITGRSSSEAYMIGFSNDQSIVQDVYYFFKLDNGKWSVVDSAFVRPGFAEYKWGYGKLWYSPWNTLYSVGDGLFVWSESSGWKRILYSANSLVGIAGTGPDNILVVGNGGQASHFDGSHWVKLGNLNFPHILYDVWLSERESFIIGSDGRVTYILHGK